MHFLKVLFFVLIASFSGEDRFFGSAASARTIDPSPDFRIVSLTPALTQVLADLGLNRYVVGYVTVPGSPAPSGIAPEAKSVGTYAKPMIEKIVELKPTHVVMIKEGEDRISSFLEKAKLKKILLEGRHIDDFVPMVKTLSTEFVVPAEKADGVVQQWETDWKNVLAQEGTKSALLMLQVDPSYVAGKDTFLSEVLGRCGWQNAVEAKGYPRMNRENLERLKMDKIVYFAMAIESRDEVLLKKFWEKSVKHRSTPLLVESNPKMAQLTSELPRLARAFCEKLSSQ